MKSTCRSFCLNNKEAISYCAKAVETAFNDNGLSVYLENSGDSTGLYNKDTGKIMARFKYINYSTGECSVAI